MGKKMRNIFALLLAKPACRLNRGDTGKRPVAKASASKPSQPTSRRILKLFMRVRRGRPCVTDQWRIGFPGGETQSDSGRWSHSSKKAEYSNYRKRPFIHLFQANLPQSPLTISGSEGRLCDSNNP